ncbi:MAG: type II secretion system F family protein [Planctomycetota bacterium]|jgi:type IV pilus assembly protein PilC|nr:type II secretion system F family protein [Planctomycetota bacterium]MDP6764176.1 type II secretion system F family protein [Planctomycetota bacterium]MDP6989647.1 type II secretion system F family protein [Planctomycetota bacterium]
MAKKIRRSAPAPRGPSPSERGGASAGSAGPRRSRKRVNAQLVTEFTIQLSTLVEAGIPVVKALKILEGQTKSGPFKAVLADLVDAVSGGAPLSESMAKHEGVFDDLYSNMVRAGEAGGVLDQILERLATFREKAAEIQSNIRGAMIYPAVILLVAMGVMSAVIVWVIPRFKEIFDSFSVELPGVTQMLLDISDFTVQYWYLAFGAPVALLMLHGLMMRRGGGYRYSVHSLALKLPVIGGVVSHSLIATFTRTFGTLIQAGVPHLDALGIIRDATGNDVLRVGIEDVRRTVREGEGLARPMGETGLFDDLVINMVDVGEETGELDRMLLKVADAYEVQVDRRIEAMFKLLEPVLLVLIAALVGFIVVALFMPLLEIMSTLGSM